MNLYDQPVPVQSFPVSILLYFRNEKQNMVTSSHQERNIDKAIKSEDGFHMVKLDFQMPVLAFC